jgi:hypothetical protein
MKSKLRSQNAARDARVEHVAQSIAKNVDGKNRRCNAKAGK